MRYLLESYRDRYSFNAASQSDFILFFRGEDEEDEDEDGDSEEDSSEESDEEAESSAATPEQPVLTRAEKRDLKKKQAEEKEGNEGEEDPDLINPNHVQQKLNISDLNTPRELSRRERYDRISLIFKHILIFIFI